MIVDDLESPINLNVSDNFETIRQKCRFSRRTKTAFEFHLWAYWTWWWRSRYIWIGKKNRCWWRIWVTESICGDIRNNEISGCTFEWDVQRYDWNAPKRWSWCHLSRYSDYLRNWYQTKITGQKLSKKINRSATLSLTKGPVVNQKSLNILEIGLNSGQKHLSGHFCPI